MLKSLFTGVAVIVAPIIPVPEPEQVVAVLEEACPGISTGKSVTDNLLAPRGLVLDLYNAPDLGTAVTKAYGDIIGPGSLVNNLGEGGGLGIECLLPEAA